MFKLIVWDKPVVPQALLQENRRRIRYIHALCSHPLTCGSQAPYESNVAIFSEFCSTYSRYILSTTLLFLWVFSDVFLILKPNWVNFHLVLFSGWWGTIWFIMCYWAPSFKWDSTFLIQVMSFPGLLPLFSPSPSPSPPPHPLPLLLPLFFSDCEWFSCNSMSHMCSRLFFQTQSQIEAMLSWTTSFFESLGHPNYARISQVLHA